MKYGYVFAILMTLSLGFSSPGIAQQDRGMQTAPPRSNIGNTSPRTIDFSNTGAGTPVQPGTRQIPLQNLPFGERPRENFEQMWNQAEQQGLKVKEGKSLWPKLKNPFKRNADAGQNFQLPGNLNRKPNYSNGTVLTDGNPNGFQMPKLFEKPQWMTDMNQKTKDMFSFNKNKQLPQVGNVGNWAQKTSEDWRTRNNQAWQNFSNNLNPKNWNGQNPRPNSVTPPLRQATNWQDSIQTNRR
jgi:hypothetical protein